MKTIIALTAALILTACGTDEKNSSDSSDAVAEHVTQAQKPATSQTQTKTSGSGSDIFERDTKTIAPATIEKTENSNCLDTAPSDVHVGIVYTRCDGSLASGTLDVVAQAKAIMGCPVEADEVELPSTDGECIDPDLDGVRFGVAVMMCDGSMRSGYMNVQVMFANVMSQGQKLCQ